MATILIALSSQGYWGSTLRIRGNLKILISQNPSFNTFGRLFRAVLVLVLV